MRVLSERTGDAMRFAAVVLVFLDVPDGFVVLTSAVFFAGTDALRTVFFTGAAADRVDFTGIIVPQLAQHRALCCSSSAASDPINSPDGITSPI